jgi:hypothetical protein
MSRIIIISFLAFFLAAGLNLSGQQKAGSKPTAKSAGRKIFIPPVYFGNSDYRGGPIQKERFCELLRQGLSSHDSLGNKYQVIGFDFSYAEQKVYEDSIGNLFKMMDFSSEFCAGDTISRDISTTDTTVGGDVSLSIYQRIKPGDTVYFDHIMVQKRGANSLLSIPDTVVLAGRAIKSVIVK